ncbi:MAG: LPS assembly lipoprotein LptE [Gammaproteobacteria bacterium]|jgi:LPS-assembly lipoprotein
MRRTVAPALLVACAVLVGGCGFRLQGSTPLPAVVATVQLDAADDRTPFAQALRRRLGASGATLAPRGATVSGASGAAGAASGVAVLRIERDEVLERVTSVSARNIPREYELTQVVRFSLDAGGTRRISSAEVSASRSLTFDERRALAKEREREQLRETLADEVAGVVLQRVAGLR